MHNFCSDAICINQNEKEIYYEIGILGSGDVGRRLADGFIELEHTVKIGSRDPNQEKITEWIAKHNKEKVSSETFAETASFGELNVLATFVGWYC
ncbi:MAG: NAD(P)-binding domain-containing protein [Nitrososphaeraceae archaeon]